jgi:hypothetical protein
MFTRKYMSKLSQLLTFDIIVVGEIVWLSSFETETRRPLSTAATLRETSGENEGVDDMASAAHLMKRMNLSTGKHGIAGVLIDGVAGFGASYALGQVHHRYQDKWAGKHAPRLMAAFGKLGAVALSYFNGGHPSMAVGLVDAVGQAGVNAMGLELGLRHARGATGKKAVMVSTTALPGSKTTAVGALGQAAAGRGLSWSQIEEMASGH